jgi:pseudouridine synthase
VQNGDDDPGQWSYIELGEGRHHEVRRLYGAVGHPVLRLVRLSFGPVSLGELAPGEMRDLRSDERISLKTQLAAAPQPRAS